MLQLWRRCGVAHAPWEMSICFKTRLEEEEEEEEEEVCLAHNSEAVQLLRAGTDGEELALRRLRCVTGVLMAMPSRLATRECVLCALQ